MQRSGLEALHRLEHRVFNLTQAGFRMRFAPRDELTSNCVAQHPPPRQHAIQVLLVHVLLHARVISEPERHFTGLRKKYAGHPPRPGKSVS